jgi:hypothetical protein
VSDETPAKSAPAAAIHDIGYKRYLGTRRPQSTRYRVIVKNVIAHAWRGWWRMKIWVFGAVVVVVTLGAIMVALRHRVFRELEDMAGGQVSFADGLLAYSLRYMTPLAFILTVTVVSGVVARDLRAGAFEFYFSRPVRPVDYVLGKIGGVVLIMATALLAGPLLLSLHRLAVVEDISEIRGLLPVVPKALLVGTFATLAYSIVPLAFSAISSNPRHTIAIWAAFYIVGGGIAGGIAHGTGISAIGALDLTQAVAGMSFDIFDLNVTRANLPSLFEGMAVLSLYILAALGFIFWRVVRAERAGLGGS